MRCVILAVILSLAGCASVETARLRLRTVTVADLETAIQIAQKHQDQEALQCYPVLLELAKQRDTSLIKPAGVVSAFEAARVVVEHDADPVLRRINLACAALFTDGAATIAKLAAKLGLVP